MATTKEDRVAALREVEESINVALIVMGDDDPDARRGLLEMRRIFRATVLGEAATT
jgi:hypothetical protein